ncbi:MAG: 2-C-methyl-D-erythritol 4-phosphate cytidylyltransferase [Candidatus Sumerlaeia bacterium]|nr:2-C-methyl-D-erythritol 4-phosphate cytidylyltransferase [Candidatus Sumerlaeia bacterium]
MSPPRPPARRSTPGKAFALVVAGGVGKRIGSETPKQFLPLRGKPLLWHSLTVFDAHPEVSGICVVVDERWHGTLMTAEPWTSLTKPLLLALPGQERSDSVRNGLKGIRESLSAAPERGDPTSPWAAAHPRGDGALVLIHDAARPLVTARMISKSLALARAHGGAILARPVPETVKRADSGGTIESTIDRRGLWIAETPQTFVLDLIWRAHQEAHAAGVHLTDDAQAVERLGEPVLLCSAETPNPKVTVPEDLVYVEALMRQRLQDGAS